MKNKIKNFVQIEKIKIFARIAVCYPLFPQQNHSLISTDVDQKVDGRAKYRSILSTYDQPLSIKRITTDQISTNHQKLDKVAYLAAQRAC
jgi:hypothetical protein